MRCPLSASQSCCSFAERLQYGEREQAFMFMRPPEKASALRTCQARRRTLQLTEKKLLKLKPAHLHRSSPIQRFHWPPPPLLSSTEHAKTGTKTRLFLAAGEALAGQVRVRVWCSSPFFTRRQCGIAFLAVSPGNLQSPNATLLCSGHALSRPVSLVFFLVCWAHVKKK